jgi:hypothetical protein
MRKILSTFCFLLVINTCLMSQASFDYYPKSLQTELAKANGNNVELSEFSVLPKLAKSVKLGKFFKVADFTSFSPIKYVYVGRVKTCRAGGCSVYNNDAENVQSEYFDYFILYDVSCSIQLVKIYNYQATHGQEVTSTNWLRQFRSYNGRRELIVGKDVDAISGATISVDATTFDVEHKTKILEQSL